MNELDWLKKQPSCRDPGNLESDPIIGTEGSDFENPPDSASAYGK